MACAFYWSLSTLIYFSCSQGKTVFRQTRYQMVHEPRADNTAGNFALNVHEICVASLTLTEVIRRTGICLYCRSLS